jgi:hypothetical protein
MSAVSDGESNRASVTALLLDVRKMLESCQFDGKELRFPDSHADELAAATTEEPGSSGWSSPSRSHPPTPGGSEPQRRAVKPHWEVSQTSFVKPSTPRGNVDSGGQDTQRELRKDWTVREPPQGFCDVADDSRAHQQRQDAAQIGHLLTLQDKRGQQFDTLFNRHGTEAAAGSCQRAGRWRKPNSLAGASRGRNDVSEARAKPGEDWLSGGIHVQGSDGRTKLKMAG